MVNNSYISEKVQDVVRYFELGQFENADILLNELLILDNKNYDILFLKGTLCGIQLKHEECKNYFLCAEKINPDNPFLQYNIAKSMSDLGENELALERHKRVIELMPENPDAWINYGKCFFNLQHYIDAINSFNQAIQLNQNNPEAYCNRGIALRILDRNDEALASFNKAIYLRSDFSEAHYHQGNTLQHLNRFDEALDSYNNAIKYNSCFIEAYSNRGLVLYKLKFFDKALESFNSALNINPDFAEAHCFKGNVLQELKCFNEAILSYDKAIELQHNYAQAYCNRGNALQHLGLFEEALLSLNTAIEFNQYMPEAFSNLGNVLLSLNRLNEALDSFDIAIKLNKNFFEAYSNRGNVFRILKRFDEAIKSYDEAISINPNYAQAYSNRGLAFKENNNLNDAIKDYCKAIQLNPNFAEAYWNHGLVLHELGSIDEALDSFLNAFYINPNHEYLLGTLLHTKLQVCNWLDLDDLISRAIKLTLEGKKTSTPFQMLLLTDSPSIHYKASKIWANGYYKNTHKNYPNDGFTNDESKIRIGYFSADLYFHPASIWLVEQIENHDRSKFELYAFSLKSVIDPMQTRLQSAFDHWINVESMSDEEVVKLSRELRINIAIDLNMYTMNSRSGIFASRVAPIQISSIGYPSTSGSEFIDYFISDQYSVSQKSRQFFSEKIVFVPSGSTYDKERQLCKKPILRSNYGLPDNCFIFTCQNGCQKITPEVFNIWMEILNAVPNSVLWLLKPNSTAIKNLKMEAGLRGVDNSRLIFTEREIVSVDNELNRISRYLASYQLADLFLDTWPYNAGTTAVDALWAGTPVLTKVGDAASSRMTYSALNQIDVPDLITYTTKEYKESAISLAEDPIKLNIIKDKILRNRLCTPLFDSIKNTRYIENAYLEMHKKYVAHLPIDDFYIEKY